MSFEVIENVFTIKADIVMTVAMAAVLLLIGYFIKSKVNFLAKYCIPAPVVGGFLFMLVTWAGHTSGAFAFSFTTTLQSFFMLAFFTTVGLGASLSLLKKGGMLLVIYWLVAGIVSICQNIIGISLSSVTGSKACLRAAMQCNHHDWRPRRGRCLWQHFRKHGLPRRHPGGSGCRYLWTHFFGHGWRSCCPSPH
jgi:hypothetical protein